MKNVLLQHPASAETKSIQIAAMLNNPSPGITRCRLDQVHEHSEGLAGGDMLPVGSVEFLRAAMEASGIVEPENLSYHPSVKPFLRRDVKLTSASQVHHRMFVKPASTKVFTGFVYDPNIDPRLLSDHDQEQRSAFLALAPETPVWIAPEVTFVGEWRYYILDQKILGCARYDPDGPDEISEPNPDFVQSIIGAIPLDHPYALDIGALEEGSLAVVELNDAWAIGLYGRSLEPKSYLKFLAARWDTLIATRKDRAA